MKSDSPDYSKPDAYPERTLVQNEDAVTESLQLSIPQNVIQHGAAPKIPGYILRELLGEGAYGQVWRAWQVRTRKEVAVKVFTQTGGLDWIFLQREVERLTRLDRHPHVVTMLDANLSAERPFYAMELIEGGSLQQFVQSDRPAPLKRVLRWMGQLCDALQYVHSKGLIHCDLKPANILIDEQDNVRVVDFGQSRVFTDATASFGTLFYMAPEQATIGTPDQPVHPDVRWDIYSLGATLYAVLTGRVPRATPENMRALEQAASLQDRLRVYQSLCAGPVSANEKGGDSRTIDPELSAVLGMCMATRPDDRYKTMAGVMRDLTAIRECRPVTPLAGSVTYRAKKHVQRNPLRLTLMASLLLSLIAFAVYSSVQADRIAKERDKALAISRFMIEVFQNPDPRVALGRKLTAEDILDLGAGKIENELKSQPEVMAPLVQLMGTVYTNLGQYDKAEPLLEKALTLRRREFGEESEQVAESLHRLAGLYREQREADKAVECAQRALGIYRKIGGEESDSVAGTTHSLAVALLSAGKFDEAEQALNKAIELWRRLPGDNRAELANSLHNLGKVLLSRRRTDDGERLINEGLTLRRGCLPQDDPAIAASLNELAGIYWGKLQFADAERVMGECITITRKVLGPNHPALLRHMNNLARVLWPQGKFDEAERLLFDALEGRRKVFGGDENQDVATSFQNLGELYLAKKDLEQAESYLQKALTIRRKLLKPEDPSLATTLMNLGDVLASKGDIGLALPILRESLDIRQKKSQGDDDRNVADVKRRLGFCLAAMGQFEEAESLLSSCLPVISGHYGADNEETVRTVEQLIAVYEGLKRPDDAARYKAMLPAKAG